MSVAKYVQRPSFFLRTRFLSRRALSSPPVTGGGSIDPLPVAAGDDDVMGATNQTAPSASSTHPLPLSLSTYFSTSPSFTRLDSLNQESNRTPKASKSFLRFSVIVETPYVMAFSSVRAAAGTSAMNF